MLGVDGVPGSVPGKSARPCDLPTPKGSQFGFSTK